MHRHSQLYSVFRTFFLFHLSFKSVLLNAKALASPLCKFWGISVRLFFNSLHGVLIIKTFDILQKLLVNIKSILDFCPF